MCTSIAICNREFYFGRNMDIEGSFGEKIVTAPRRYPFLFRRAEALYRHYSMVGTAAVAEGYPLFADGMNEAGLCMAGLNFPGNAFYGEPREGKEWEIAPFELIPWVLGRCASVAEARHLLQKTKLVSIPFSDKLALTPLHWHLADKSGSLVIEPLSGGLQIYDDPVGILTNNPPFPTHLADLDAHANLSPRSPDNRLSDDVSLFSLGLGAVGLPGDFSSRSRFIRAAFAKSHLIGEEEEEGRVAQFFHLLSLVAPPRGCVLAENGLPHYTTYSCCMSPEAHAYYTKPAHRLSPRKIAVVLSLTEWERLIVEEM